MHESYTKSGTLVQIPFFYEKQKTNLSCIFIRVMLVGTNYILKVAFYISDGYRTLNFLLMRTSIIAMHSKLQLVGSCGKVMESTAKSSWITTILYKF